MPLPDQLSSVICNCRCQCDAEYIARTDQRLETRIDEHVLIKICQEWCKNLHLLVHTSGSAIAEHLIKNSSVKHLDYFIIFTSM